MQHGDSGGNGMNHTLKTAIVGMLVLAILGPALIQMAACLIPLVLVVGVVAVVLRLVWFYTRGW